MDDECKFENEEGPMANDECDMLNAKWRTVNDEWRMMKNEWPMIDDPLTSNWDPETKWGLPHRPPRRGLNLRLRSGFIGIRFSTRAAWQRTRPLVLLAAILTL